MRLRGVALALNLCGAQIATAAIAATLIGLFWGRAAAAAALFGGAVAIVPTAYFTVRLYLRRGGSSGAETLGAFYRAETGKLLLTVFLFWLGALLFGNHFAALMITCAACLSMNWLMLAVTKG